MKKYSWEVIRYSIIFSMQKVYEFNTLLRKNEFLIKYTIVSVECGSALEALFERVEIPREVYSNYSIIERREIKNENPKEIVKKRYRFFVRGEIIDRAWVDGRFASFFFLLSVSLLFISNAFARTAGDSRWSVHTKACTGSIALSKGDDWLL